MSQITDITQVAKAGDNTTNDEATRGERKFSIIPTDQDEEAPKSATAPSPDAWSAGLVINAQVYALADKYDIPQLKWQAKLKFFLLSRQILVPGFPKVVHEVLTSTPHTDRGLREALLDIFTINWHYITKPGSLRVFGEQEHQELLSVLSHEGEFVFELSVRLGQHFLQLGTKQTATKLKESEEKVQKLELEIKNLNQRLGQRW